jgi:hypothetical protein
VRGPFAKANGRMWWAGCSLWYFGHLSFKERGPLCSKLKAEKDKEANYYSDFPKKVKDKFLRFYF